MPQKQPQNQNNVINRPPVVVVMGHIDHGKSSLLDYIRKTNTTKKEAGNITQHVSAYEISYTGEEGAPRKITFIDTPGHAAFSLMRERGATAADVAILVVAADDGVKAQTLEALTVIRQGGVPFIVAINKIDKPNVNLEIVKQQLAENDVYVEGYGGDVPVVVVSAVDGTGIPDLLSMILLVADIEELRADPTLPAEGIVIEAHREARTGISATVIIKNGTLKKGMYAAVGDTYTSTRRIENFLGEEITEATVSAPIRLFGFSILPSAGALLKAFEREDDARNYVEEYKAPHVTKELPAKKTTAEDDAGEETVFVPVVVKADTSGTLEAVEEEIKKITVPRVYPQILMSGIGAINDTDVSRVLGGGTGGIVVGFNTKIDRSAKEIADRGKISISAFSIIYELSEWLEKELTKRKPRVTTEETAGEAKIIRTFSRTKDKQVVGGRVKEGALYKGAGIKILRREHEIGRGKILELQQKKVKTAEVKEGNEFGALIESHQGIAEGDVIEAVKIVEK